MHKVPIWLSPPLIVIIQPHAGSNPWERQKVITSPPRHVRKNSQKVTRMNTGLKSVQSSRQYSLNRPHPMYQILSQHKRYSSQVAP